VPVWHEATREAVRQGRLALLGVTQEQHSDRCRLLAQWKGFDWPILHDPIDLLEASAVPIVVAIDEHGIVRAVRPRVETFAAEFLDRMFTDDAPLGDLRTARPPDPDLLRREAEASSTAPAWVALGNALTIWCGEQRLDDAIDAYTRALTLDPTDANARFRLGVAHRMRHESARRRPGDFQAAVDAWGSALALDPNQYIWRRRIEQYGPRLAKPYPFYGWVTEARDEITRRGQVPIVLGVEPYGSEIAGPARDVLPEATARTEPDPQGRIHRDLQGLIDAEVVVVPAQVRPGQAARVHVTLRPSATHEARWNNESTPLQIWIAGAEGWTVSAQLLEAPPGQQPESDEVRRLDFEVQAPTAAEGKVRLAAYALYNACEKAGGTCLFLRHDLTIELDVTR
jgi:tetratricopeptide (TPR) repeat protein